MLTVSLLSCSKAWPGGFWLGFHEKQIIERASDQGPYGGSRFILWKSEQPSVFSINEVIAFAHKNGWTYKASSPLSLANLQASLPIINSKTEALHRQNDNTQGRKIRNAFTSDLKILFFSTGWEKVDAGTGKSSTQNGMILLSDNGKAMAVFQSWGE